MKTAPQFKAACVAAALALGLLLPLRLACAQATNAAEPEELRDLKVNSIDTLLKMYCEFTGRTLLQEPALNTKTPIDLRSGTKKLTRDEILQAFKAVLAMNNIALVEIGDKFTKVVTIANAQSSGLAIQMPGTLTNRIDADEIITEIISLKHIDPAEAQKAIQGLLHPYGKVMPLERINSLMIADTLLALNRIHEILDAIDKPLDIKEQLVIRPILHAKASDVKAKITEILEQAKGQQKAPQPTVAMPRPAGPPGVIPGLIRPTPTRAAPTAATIPQAPADTGATEESNVGKMIRGDVKIVADDRTSILIIITHPDNLKFLDQAIEALDKVTEPDVVVRVIRLEFGEAETVSSMLNALIGAAAPKQPTAPKPGTVAPGAKPEAGEAPRETKSTVLEDYVRQQREAAASSQASQAEGIKSKIGELSAENIKILADKRTNALIVMGTKRDLATIEEIIKGMDIMLSQVLIEAIILEINLGGEIKTGVDWVQRSMVAYDKNPDGTLNPIAAFAGGGGGGTLTPQDATALSSTASLQGMGGGLTYYFTHFGLNLDAVVRMSSSDTRTKILSSPIIMTTDNKEAKIDVSTERYFYKGQRYVNTGSTTSERLDDVEMKKVGISLIATPHINQKRFVVMELAQKIQNVSEYQQINDGQWPVVASSEFSASIAVSSGETIVLGGLSQAGKDRTRSKIPVLGDIPLLGLLFSSMASKNQRKETLVFITPYVMDTPEEIELAARRTHSAMGKDARWKRAWSDSKLGEENPAFQKILDAEMARIHAATNATGNQPFPAPLAESNVLNDADTAVFEVTPAQDGDKDNP